jgi:hypothetical protein
VRAHRPFSAQKSKPRNAAREIFVCGVAEVPREVVSAVSRSAQDAKKARQTATKIDAIKCQYESSINYLNVGWGARIRTREWRNQNLPDDIDWPTYFSRLIGSAHVADQRLTDGIPTIASPLLTTDQNESAFALRSRPHPFRPLAWLDTKGVGDDSQSYGIGAGIFAIAWAVLNPNANTAARVMVSVLGVVSLIAARAFECERRASATTI